MSLWDSDDVIPREVFLAKIRGVSGIFCTLNDKIDDGVLEAAGNLLCYCLCVRCHYGTAMMLSQEVFLAKIRGVSGIFCTLND